MWRRAMGERSTGLRGLRLRVTIAALIIGVSVAIIGFCGWSRSSMPADPPVLASRTQAPSKPTPRFRQVSQGDGFDKTIGGPCFFAPYETSHYISFVGTRQK